MLEAMDDMLVGAGQGPGEEGAAEELEVEPAAGKEAAGANEALADDDADLEGALESVEEGMQALNVDDEVISQVSSCSLCLQEQPSFVAQPVLAVFARMSGSVPDHFLRLFSASTWSSVRAKHSAW